MAFGVFVTLSLSGYIANLASFLVTKKVPVGAYNDVYDVVNDGEQLCMWASAYKTFAEIHPLAADSVINVSSTEEAMDNLNAGICKGVVNSQLENERMLSQSDHCDKLEVGPPVMTLMLSQPVNDRYAKVLSYWLVRETKLKSSLVNVYSPQDFCPPKVTLAQSKQMDIADYYGIFLITAVATCGGLLVRAVRYAHARYKGEDLFEDPATRQSSGAQAAAAADPARAPAPGSTGDDALA